MAEASAKIRPYQPDDFKLVQFVVSKANMGQLAVANRAAFFHPLMLGLWVGFSSVFVQVMGWWPRDTIASYLTPIPAFACIALPLLYFIDWNNRPFFEDEAQQALKGPDLVDIPEYYSRSPSSGLWVLEYGERFIGLLALDASLDSQKTELEPPSKKDKKTKKGTSPVATIRHFFVDEPYRPTGIQNDLLKYAIRFAFEHDSKLQRVEVVSSPLSPYAQAFKAAGFRLQKEIKKVGVMRWPVELYSLDRDVWQPSSNSS